MTQQQQEQDMSNEASSTRTERTEYTECSTVYNDERPDDYFLEEEQEKEEERKITVRFSEQVWCKATISRSDFTPKEILACWYTEEESEKLLNKYHKTCERRESGKKPKKNSTYRGLENFDEYGALEIQYIIENCVEAVLDEQERQIDEGIFDEDALAEVSMTCSEECRNHALAMGKADEREAIKAVRRMMTPNKQDSCHSLSSYTVGPAPQDLKTLISHKVSQQQTAIVVRSTSPVFELPPPTVA